MLTNLDYIKQVHISDIPWNSLSTPYSRATMFPAWFKQMTGENEDLAIDAARDIALNIEHQSTLWQVTPFAMIILDRLLCAAIDKLAHTGDDLDKLVIKNILAIYAPVFDTVAFMQDNMNGVEPLPRFIDMLKPEYLLPSDAELMHDGFEDAEDALEACLEMQYLEMPDELFYSFFYYAWMVLAFSLNKNSYKLIEINDIEIKNLLNKMQSPQSRAFLDGLMYG